MVIAVLSLDRLTAILAIVPTVAISYITSIPLLVARSKGKTANRSQLSYKPVIEELVATFQSMFPEETKPTSKQATIIDTQIFDSNLMVDLDQHKTCVFYVKQLTYQFVATLLLQKNPLNLGGRDISMQDSSVFLKALNSYKESSKKSEKTDEIFSLVTQPDFIPLILTNTEALDSVFSLQIAEIFVIRYKSNDPILSEFDFLEDLYSAVDSLINQRYPQVCEFFSYYNNELKTTEDPSFEMANRIKNYSRQKLSLSKKEKFNTENEIIQAMGKIIQLEEVYERNINPNILKLISSRFKDFYKLIQTREALSLLSCQETKSFRQLHSFLVILEYLYQAKIEYGKLFSDSSSIKLHLRKEAQILIRRRPEFLHVPLNIEDIISTIPQKEISIALKDTLERLSYNLKTAFWILEWTISQTKQYPIELLRHLFLHIEHMRIPYLPLLAYYSVELLCYIADQYASKNLQHKGLKELETITEKQPDLLDGKLCLKLTELSDHSSKIKEFVQLACTGLGIRYPEPKEVVRLDLSPQGQYNRV